MKFLQVVKQKNGKISFGFFATMGGGRALRFVAVFYGHW